MDVAYQKRDFAPWFTLTALWSGSVFCGFVWCDKLGSLDDALERGGLRRCALPD